jgi:hypothetical protein
LRIDVIRAVLKQGHELHEIDWNDDILSPRTDLVTSNCGREIGNSAASDQLLDGFVVSRGRASANTLASRTRNRTLEVQFQTGDTKLADANFRRSECGRRRKVLQTNWASLVWRWSLLLLNRGRHRLLILLYHLLHLSEKFDVIRSGRG